VCRFCKGIHIYDLNEVLVSLFLDFWWNIGTYSFLINIVGDVDCFMPKSIYIFEGF
jgi:hypothetical protein